MANYAGLDCPICGKRFEQGDDVVFCPECGTPHHRECYKDNGVCANELRHAEGFVFESPKVNVIPKKEGANLCPYCGTENPNGAVFCVRCGKDIATRTSQNSYTTHFGTPQDFSVYGGVNPDQEFDGVKARDIATFIGKNSGYYLYQFQNMNRRGKKISFSFSGFFITPIYMFYRKMWGMGIFTGLLNAALGLPALLLNYLDLFDVGKYAQIIDKFGADPINVVLMVLSLLSMLYSMYFGLFANNIYQKNVIKKIKKIKAQNKAPQDEVLALEKKGGISYGVMVVLIVLLGIGYALSFASAMM